MKKISIVIPLCNEEESLSPLMNQIHEVMGSLECEYEVLFVDDGSTDGSFGVLQQLRNQFGNIIRIYRLSNNCGKSAALSLGIKEASGEIIITMDADLQDDPVAIPEMLKKIDEGWDVVNGWKKKRYDPITFTLPSKIWNFATSILSGVKLHDFNCGFKAYRAEAAKSLDIYGDRHRYLPALAFWDGFRVTEIPVPHHARKYGKSKYGFGKFFNGLMDMMTLLFLRRYLKSPLHFFGLIGFVLIMIGGTVLGYFGIEWAISGAMRVRPLMVLSLGAIIVGIQFLSFGFLAEMLINMAPKKLYTIREKIE
ncbi:MAG: glycosyltransferase family 2 protein [Fibrobacter sp.]|jgi:glycosyltransferase involved in cell wall biosynthesis|nr:glycosyltransferase family 2 protein [Fibrobacter sp.]